MSGPLRIRSWSSFLVLGATLQALAGCGADSPSGSTSSTGTQRGCNLQQSMLVDSGIGKDGLRALTGSVIAEAGSSEAAWVPPDQRVIGVVLNGQPIAIPHALGWVHEVVNLNVGGERLAVTHCPLTGSSLVFDRARVDDPEFGVSGLLYVTNLVMYDRRTEESLWPQMSRSAGCGTATGTGLDMVPAVEMTWDGWRTLHPDTRVPAHDPSIGQRFSDYRYPYGTYDRIDNDEVAFPIPFLDDRRLPKERVLGVPVGPPVAFPFEELASLGPMGVAEAESVVVFWDGPRSAAVAYHPSAADQGLSFAVEDGRFVDNETGTEWTLDDRATAGPLAGEALEPVAEAYVAFWFAWAVFHPQTGIWRDAGGVAASPRTPSVTVGGSE